MNCLWTKETIDVICFPFTLFWLKIKADYERCYFLYTEINGNCGEENSRAAKDAGQSWVFKTHPREKINKYQPPSVLK